VAEIEKPFPLLASDRSVTHTLVAVIFYRLRIKDYRGTLKNAIDY